MEDSLEALLEKATNPKNRYEDWEFIMAFCDKVNADPEGPQTTLRIIVPKMQHKDMKVAQLALALLEACVKNCGRRFHQELGKFRFLNELIRMISPKYLGNEISEEVRKKITALLYSWKIGLPNEPKIAEAYEMLKKQGLVFDESVGPDPTLEDPASKPRVALQEDPRQSQMLGKLIKSQNPEDLRAANRLIRDMVRRDEKRMEKLKKRLDDLELIENNVRLLNEMLAHFKPETASEHERQIIEELHSSVEKMRPQLFRMASELQPNEEGMTEILSANDSLIRVLDYFQRVMGLKKEDDPLPKTITSFDNNEQQTTPTSASNEGESGVSDLLLDLADLNFGNPPAMPPTVHSKTELNNSGINLLDDLNLGLPTLPTNLSSSQLPPPTMDIMGTSSSATSSGQQVSSQTGFDLLGDLTLPPMGLPPSLGGQPNSVTTTTVPPPSGFLMTTPTMATPSPSINSMSSPMFLMNELGGGANTDPLSLVDSLFIPIDSIKTGTQAPLQVLSKGGVTVSLLFTQNNPGPDITVLVLSTISTNPFPISNYLVQAAAPKVMKVKLQPPSASDLAAFNPLVPPASISQIILLANPTKAPIRLRFRISYTPQGGTEIVEIAETSFSS